MKKIVLSLFFVLVMSNLFGQSVKEKLMNSGAWFLFSTKIEQQEGDNILTHVEFFKKEDVSSLLFDNNNRLYSVFSDSVASMNEDLWQLVDDNWFVITDMNGNDQVMQIVELSNNKLVLRYCDHSVENSSKCLTSTYFSTKAGWLSDAEVQELNSVGLIEVRDLLN